MLDIKMIGQDAHLIDERKIDLYYADWIKNTVEILMLEAYDAGEHGLYPPEKDKGMLNEWENLRKYCSERVDTMLDIGRLYIKEAQQ